MKFVLNNFFGRRLEVEATNLEDAFAALPIDDWMLPWEGETEILRLTENEADRALAFILSKELKVIGAANIFAVLRPKKIPENKWEKFYLPESKV